MSTETQVGMEVRRKGRGDDKDKSMWNFKVRVVKGRFQGGRKTGRSDTIKLEGTESVGPNGSS